MRPVSKLLLTTSLIFLSSHAYAEDTSIGDDASGASDIVVTGTADSTRAAAGTKGTLPIAETPQSISVISSEDIDHLGLANLNQSLRYVAGITPETRGANAEIYDQFKLRGFDAPIYLDGLKQFSSATGYAAPQIDVSRLDRIEVVKGPASALYGQSSPGGLVAMTSKLPLDKEFYGSASATYGTYNLYRVDADVGGKLSDRFSARLYGSVNGADTQQYFGKRVRQTVSGAVTAKIDERTTLTVLGAYSHDPNNGNYGGAPASGTLFANPNGRISTQFADGEPGDFFRRNQAAGTYILNHDFGGGWAFRAAGRYQHVTTDLGAVYQTGVATDATMSTFGRGSYATNENLSNWTFDNQLSGHVTTGPIRHDLLFGIDHQSAHSRELAAFGSADPINAFAPVYGTQIVPQSPYDISSSPYSYDVHQEQTGIYAQDQMSWGGLRVLLSGRHDWSVANDGSTDQHDHKFTGRVGVLYKTRIGLAPYVSYATSFEPQSGQVLHSDASVSMAKPSMGKEVEAGIKYQPAGSAMLISAAWFHIEQSNLLTAIPSSIYSTQSGKVRSEGLEIEAKVPLPGGFAFRGAYGHQKVRTVADVETPTNIGQGIIGVGNGNLAVNLDWHARSGPLKGLMLGAGLRHVEHVYGGQVDGVATYSPAYTLADALVRYDLGQASHRLSSMELALNVTNLFDKTYLTSCYITSVGWCWYGQRRTVQGTISWHW
ncbi:TonB-dependent siderophore receptor [Novosphingobium nitrogenifigens]|nr:TonB-dependent siderophore receptor [Novosphingobium nitrogenifigens]